MLVEWATVEAIDKHTQCTLEHIRAAREAARRSGQTGQVVSQLGVVAFDRESVCFALRNFVSAVVIPKSVIGIKRITVIAFGLGSLIYHLLDGLLSALPDHFPTQITACLPVYDREDIDPVFLLPIKVNSSSISASFTSSGKGASGKLAACALTHNETVR